MKKKSKLDEAMTLALRACDMARSLDSRWCKRNMEVDKRFAELEYFPPIREWKAERDRNRQEGEARTRAAEELKVLFEDHTYARKEIAYEILKLFAEPTREFTKEQLPDILLKIVRGK
jgi:hypothetical protein